MVLRSVRAFRRAASVLALASLPVLSGVPLSPAAGSATPAAVAGAAAHAHPTLAASPHATAAGVGVPVATGSVTYTHSTPVTPPAATVPGPDEPHFNVLCYHQFGEQPSQGRKSLYKIARSEFEWQMQYLREQGIVPLRLDQVEDFLASGKPIPKRSVLITFDDGFRSIYTDAFPILKRYGYPAVLYLYTDFLASQNASLRYEEVAEMMRHGIAIGSHGSRHLNLARESTRLDRSAFRRVAIRELHDSAVFLKEKFGEYPRTMAFPYGVYTGLAIEEARRLGYRTAFSINPGPNDRSISHFKLRRHLVTYFTRRDLFRAIFEPGVLHLSHLAPADGGTVWTKKPVITAIVEDDVDPRTLVLKTGQRVLPHSWDPSTRTVRKELGFPLKKGGHQVTLTARDRRGIQRIYSWYFRVERRAGEDDSDEVFPADPSSPGEKMKDDSKSGGREKGRRGKGTSKGQREGEVRVK